MLGTTAAPAAVCSAFGSAAAGAWSALASARYSRLSTAKLPSSQTGVAPAVRYPTRVGGATATWSRVVLSLPPGRRNGSQLQAP
jgi:hypothetical protein